jgi:hypothetical protein
MFLRRNRRKKNGELYEYWTLVQSYRTERGPRQRIVATLGKLPGLDEDERCGWEEIARLLDGSSPEDEQMDLFAGKAGAEPPQWAQVDLSGVRVERVRQFGQVYLALALWRRLGLHSFFEENIRKGREQVSWQSVAAVLTIGRFCEQASELALSDRWYARTALDDLLGICPSAIYNNRLYRGLDQILPLREALFSHLKERYQSWFGSRFEFLLYDITSTYFEGQCEGNPQAQRGYSRDSRPDCKQVCIGLVVTPEGLPLAYEVFAGNRSDVTTVEEIVELMESKYGVAERIWAMDRGMVSEDNLDYLRGKHALYIVATPKSQLRRVEKQLLDSGGWEQVEPGVEVKLLEHPDAKGSERYVLCRSCARHQKEAAMLRAQQQRLHATKGESASGWGEALRRRKSSASRSFWMADAPSALRSRRIRANSLGLPRPRGLTCFAPTAPKRIHENSGTGTSNSLKSKTPSAPARATWDCGLFFTRNNPESRPTSSSASWPWLCGAAWRCGSRPRVSATVPDKSLRRWEASTPWMSFCRYEIRPKRVFGSSESPSPSQPIYLHEWTSNSPQKPKM